MECRSQERGTFIDALCGVCLVNYMLAETPAVRMQPCYKTKGYQGGDVVRYEKIAGVFCVGCQQGASGNSLL